MLSRPSCVPLGGRSCCWMTIPRYGLSHRNSDLSTKVYSGSSLACCWRATTGALGRVHADHEIRSSQAPSEAKVDEKVPRREAALCPKLVLQKLRFALLGPGVSLVGSPSPASLCGHTMIELGETQWCPPFLDHHSELQMRLLLHL